MDIRLLGPIEVTANRPVALGGPTPRRLLALLALRRNSVVTLGYLIDVTWQENPPDRTDRNIRSGVHRLRTALQDDGERVETVETGYRLRIEEGDVQACRRVTNDSPSLTRVHRHCRP